MYLLSMYPFWMFSCYYSSLLGICFLKNHHMDALSEPVLNHIDLSHLSDDQINALVATAMLPHTTETPETDTQEGGEVYNLFEVRMAA